MDVYWLEQTEADLPATDYWLSANEIVRLNTMSFAKRRSDWKLGRWTAKNALALYLLSLKIPAEPQILASIEIRPDTSGAPEAFFQNKPATASVSISHRAGIAACAVTCSSVMLGCDIETIAPRSDAFVANYFTSTEQSLVAEAPAVDRPRILALIWSAKESALKALHEGLWLNTREIIVSPVYWAFDFGDWNPIVVRHSGRQLFCGWWQHRGGIVRTLVTAPPPNPPIRLRVTAYASPSRLGFSYPETQEHSLRWT